MTEIRAPLVRAHVWRSSGKVGFPLLVLVVASHIVLRPVSWRHEWFWATYQFNFVDVLLGPAAACIGAWEGRRLRQRAGLVATSARPLTAVLCHWAALAAWLAAVFAAGLVAVWATVRLAGTPGLPDGYSLLSVVPALALLAGYGAFGMIAGSAFPNPVTVPLAGMVAFGVTLFGYVGGVPEQVLQVGGATGSTATLRPRLSVIGAQTVTYAAFGLLCIVAIGATVALPRRLARRTVGIATVIAVAAGIPLFFVGAPLATHRPTVVCFGRHPTVCALPGYRKYLPAAQHTLAEFRPLAEQLGYPLPDRFTQATLPGDQVWAPLPENFLTSRDEATQRTMAANIVLSSLIPGIKSCLAPDTFQDYARVATWVQIQIEPDLAAKLSSPTQSATNALPTLADARAALERMRRLCGTQHHQ